MIAVRERPAIEAGDVRARLRDPVGVCTALGFSVARPTARDCFISLRPEDDTPSCHVYIGRRDGNLVFFDHGADFGGDVLKLIAAAKGLDVKRDYGRVLEIGAEIARVPTLLTPAVKLWSGGSSAYEYPDREEVVRFWDSCIPVGRDGGAALALSQRGFDIREIADADYMRVMSAKTTERPAWARARDGRTGEVGPWTSTGHRLIVPMLDADGVLRSVRAWRIEGRDDMPKRIPPTGHKATGLVMANEVGVRLLKKAPDEWERLPKSLVILEGEPDALSWFVQLRRQGTNNVAAWGIVSGSWTPEIASRVPSGTRVAIRTHADPAGERYAEKIRESLAGRCELYHCRTEART